jgi:hypothetical protein
VLHIIKKSVFQIVYHALQDSNNGRVLPVRNALHRPSSCKSQDCAGEIGTAIWVGMGSEKTDVWQRNNSEHETHSARAFPRCTALISRVAYVPHVERSQSAESASQANMDKFYDTNAPCFTLNDSFHTGFLVIFSLGTLPLFPSQKTDVFRYKQNDITDFWVPITMSKLYSIEQFFC